MKFLLVADKYNLPRIVSVQNPYSLLNRSYEVGMAEISMRKLWVTSIFFGIWNVDWQV